MFPTRGRSINLCPNLPIFTGDIFLFDAGFYCCNIMSGISGQSGGKSITPVVEQRIFENTMKQFTFFFAPTMPCCSRWGVFTLSVLLSPTFPKLTRKNFKCQREQNTVLSLFSCEFCGISKKCLVLQMRNVRRQLKVAAPLWTRRSAGQQLCVTCQ